MGTEISQTKGIAWELKVERKMALLEGLVAAYSAEMKNPAIIEKKINNFSVRLKIIPRPNFQEIQLS
jgi:hypothetical protein